MTHIAKAQHTAPKRHTTHTQRTPNRRRKQLSVTIDPFVYSALEKYCRQVARPRSWVVTEVLNEGLKALEDGYLGGTVKYGAVVSMRRRRLL